MKIPFCGPTYMGNTSFLGDRCINFIPEVNPENAKGQITLLGTPGTTLWKNCPHSPIRGLHVVSNILFIVAGTTVYKSNLSGDLVAIGLFDTDSGAVTFSDNGHTSMGGHEVIVSDGVKLIVYNITTEITQTINDPSAAISLEYIDGYVVAALVNSLRVRCSDLNACTAWNGLAVASIGSSQDRVLGVVNSREQLWCVKEYTTEVWYNAGVATSTGFPFQRLSGAVLDVGSISPLSIARGNNSIFFPARQKTGDGSGGFIGVIKITGLQQEIISPATLTQYMSTLTHSDAFGWCMVLQGHPLYVLTFPTSDVTLVYDDLTKMWFEWSTYQEPYKVGRYIGCCYAFYNNKHLVGDYGSGDILEVSMSTYSDYNHADPSNPFPIVSTRISPHIYDNESLHNIFIHRFQVDMETGVGLTGNPYGDYVPGVRPKAQLSWSEDGGKTYSAVHFADIGIQGKRKQEVVWRKLGQSKDRVWKLSISDPIRKHIIGGYLE